MPACIRGILNLRGSVVPVVDLAVRFGRAATVATRRTCIVILEVSGLDSSQDIGVIVDGVNQVIEIRRDEIEPAPAFGARLRTDFIACMGNIDDQFVVILDCEQVLSVDEMAQLAHPGAPQHTAD
jgi:purine-binding chemotaxis protein CheW